ncbi:MAG: 1-deoxy-D-xylulose-5-phosphate synthase [Oscillospiraceae bacterium]|nr:1-deoxy-D-xylulose-5-phosphate synthase [Oscillospiraceae bacterium]
MNRILDGIISPNDLKRLSESELERLCGEIREQMIKRISVTGGHLGSNLAVIELTTALHYVFDSPNDKIIFDVSHQCYTHKLLTDRKAAYVDPNEYSSVSGFTDPDESPHDLFSVGHTSTAISLAVGTAKARDIKREMYNVIAVVGDGALSGGEAWEGLNNAAMLIGNIIIVINDNDMSISENQGGLYKNLRLLRDSGGKAECNVFRAMGFDYFFVRNGNSFKEVSGVLAEVKDIASPVIVHVCTVKGKGYPPAELDREKWHYIAPFDVKMGEPLHSVETAETYENLTRDYLINKMSTDPTIVAVTAGTPKIVGFDRELRRRFTNQFVDVGIAEDHAVTFISGMAKNGCKPVFGVSSSFLQRTYDQLSSDLALNKSPAVILVFFSGISHGSKTHMGGFDIPLASNIPNIIFLAPTCKEEYLDMLEWSIEQRETPVIIRVPGIRTTSGNVRLPHRYALPAKYEIVENGTDAAILALGSFYELGAEARRILITEHGVSVSLINPRYVSELDNDTLNGLIRNGCRMIVTLENGVLDGGFGEKIARFYGDSSVKVLCFGAPKKFIDRVSVEEQYNEYGLMPRQIVSEIISVLKS